MNEWEIINAAIESIRKTDGLDQFWSVVQKPRDDRVVNRILRRNDTIIYKTAYQLQEKDKRICSSYPIYEPEWFRNRELVEPTEVRRSRISLVQNYFNLEDNLVPELSEEAMRRSEKLLQDVCDRYGWKRQNTVFSHDRLGLLYFSKKRVLHVLCKGMPVP